MLSSESLVSEYIRTHRRSAVLHEHAVHKFPAGGATHIARVMDPFRPFITNAKGSHKWDVDGNEYIDYIMGHGALILGHSHPAVVAAVQEQMANGVHYGENHELEVKWAGLIQEMMPLAERIEFCACGQEANLMALRLARIYTGRRKVLRMRHNFHGWADELSAYGTPGSCTDEVTIVPFNDLAAVEAALRTRQYAVLLSEGGGAHMGGQVPVDLDFLRVLPEMARHYGTLFLCDEVVTGFRDSRGGWEELVGIKPDIATIGKCAGGGLPVGAVLGSRSIMAALEVETPANRRVVHSGTWNANPLVAAAGIAACTQYIDGSPQQSARRQARRFREGANKLLCQKGISGRFYSRTIVHFYLGTLDFEPDDLDWQAPTRDVDKIMNPEMVRIRTRLCLHLLQRGIATFDGEMYVFSAEHSDEDIDRTLQALDDSLNAMIQEGSIPDYLRLKR